ncbi:nitroreductase family protein [uncultured Limosilactobacillus sp.]|uniref:nitroreductase family protein n=1 Tax=uncultured Limosilactobacillus sp. TaxID=2837629 RepID=UPI0025CEC0D1|nr:nitroreductase family protein [uncultured Limosilactobacillus sp.]
MMLAAIKNRRAVRQYQSTPVSEEKIQSLVAAFQAAPCAMHQTADMQGVVVTTKELRQHIEEATNNSCYGAPLLFILVTKKGSKFGERDASVAAENIMLQATELGLGSVYIMSGALALNRQDGLLADLGVADGYEVSAIVPVGHAADQPVKEDRSHRYHLVRK